MKISANICAQKAMSMDPDIDDRANPPTHNALKPYSELAETDQASERAERLIHPR